MNAGFKSRLSLIDIFGAALRDKIDFSDDELFKGNAEDTGGLFRCDECDFEAKSELGLKKHKFNHNRETLTCMFCDYTCRFEKLLKQHIRTKHKEENAYSDDEEHKVNAETEEDTGGPYQCEYCDFLAKSLLGLTNTNKIITERH